MSFLEALAREGLINKSQIEEIKSRAAEKHGGDIDEALVELGVSPDAILESRGKYVKMPTRKVNVKDVPFEVLKYIPEDSATYYRFVPIGLQGRNFGSGSDRPGESPGDGRPPVYFR